MTNLLDPAQRQSPSATARPDRHVGAADPAFAAKTGGEAGGRRAEPPLGIGHHWLEPAILVAWRAIAAVAQAEPAGTLGAERSRR